MSEQIEAVREQDPQRMRRGSWIGYALLLSWLIYASCFLSFPLEDQTLGKWILMVIAGFGIAASAMAVLNTPYWKGSFLAVFVVLLGMYFLFWTKQLIDLGEAMPTEGLLELIRSSIRTKQRLLEYFVDKGNFIAAVQQAYWEAMPVVQAVLLVWVFAVRKRRGR